MSETTEMEGGCQCGRIRYTAIIRDDEAYFCHCRMCQRASGNVAVSFRNLAKADVRWSRGPDYYASSPIARRGFCRDCGTPLTFEYLDSDMMDLTIGSFDDPSRFTPNHHFGIEARLEHWRDTDHLPGYRADENPSTVERWMKTVGKRSH